MHLACRDSYAADIYDEPDFSRSASGVARSISALRFGAITAESQTVAAFQPMPLAPSTHRTHLVLPLDGVILAQTKHERYEVPAGHALLVARPDTLLHSGTIRASAMVLHMPRSLLQIAAARRFGEPRRLASLNMLLARPRGGAFGGALQSIMPSFSADTPNLSTRGAVLGQNLIRSLVDAMAVEQGDLTVFPVVRSVQRAIEWVRGNPVADCSDGELSRVAGITVSALQRNFRECYGMPVARFVQQARLDWVHGRLEGAHESRSISELAALLGFASAGAFSRAYQRKFGETPSQTRATAVRR